MCDHRENPDSERRCLSCGTQLVINNRIRLIKPLRELNQDPFNYIEIFEITDAGTEWDPRPKQRIMKVLKWSNPKLVELFKRESITLRQLQNLNVPRSTIDDFFTFIPSSSITLHCLVMDKFEGVNLYQWVHSNGKLSQELAFNWLEQLTKILDEVHHNEFFHRDVKPSNIIIQPNGQLALIDFGASRRITNTYMAKISASGGTSANTSQYDVTIIVTPYYTPIEQINGKAVPQSDFYALGRTFVYLLTGVFLNKLPTDKKTGKIIWRHKALQIDRIFGDLIEDLMADLPGQRPQTAEVILQRLKRLPVQSKINRIVKSKAFKIVIFILSFLATFGAYKLSKPIAANYFFIQGKKAQLDDRFADSQKNFAIAIKLNSNKTYLISDFYFEQASRKTENPKIARKYYELAIKYNADDVDAYNNLALVCQQLSDFKCVISNYESALKLNPDWSVYYGLGSFYDDRREYEKAFQQYKLAIEKSDNTAVEAINNLSRLKNKSGQYKKAEYLALQGLQKTNNKSLQTTLYKNLGWAFLRQQLYKKAILNLQKSLKLDPQRADTYCLLAQAQEKMNLTSDAKLSWEACLILNSNLPEVEGWRQEVLQRIL